MTTRQPRGSGALLTFDARETALVIGLGRSGLASTAVLRGRGATVFVTDDKPPEHLSSAIATIESQGAHFVEPARLQDILPRTTVAVLSPGVPLVAPLVRRVQDANVPVIGEIELAYRLCKAPIIAVTGTKGKSTTTALIGHLLRGCGRDVRVGGNIGNPLVSEVLEIGADGWVVAEVSSFQLETIRTFRPRVSVLLNISEDHLDRYPSMDEYAEAKFRIFANQGITDVFVGNLDDERIAALHWEHGEERMRARQVWFTTSERHRRAALYLHEGDLVYAPFTGDPRPFPLMHRDEIPLPGEHNLRNAMAALLAALAAGCEPHLLRDAIRDFQPPPHRLQTVTEIKGVRFVDDSKATNPAAAAAALRAFERPVILIAGGRPKGTNFDELGNAIRAHARSVLVIGEAADAIARLCGTVPVLRVATLEEAVSEAFARAIPGDVVLLSPACASFDMFSSAEERGERFAAAVRALGERARRA